MSSCVDKSMWQTHWTRCLFIELDPTSEVAVYTLQPTDLTRKGKTYLSLYRLYLEANDPEELSFARKYFLNYEHWETVCNSASFRPYITMWRKELELTIRAKALEAIRMEADSDGRNAYDANKFLLSGKWRNKDTVDETKSKRGRPSREEIKAKLDEDIELKKRMTNDLERIVGPQRLNS